MIIRRGTKLALGAAAAALAVGAAVAQTAGGPLPVAVQRLLDCRAAPDATRLACYDAAVGAFARLIDTGEVVVVDQERVAKVKRQAFGFSLPSLSLFDHGPKAQELDHISGTVASAYRQSDGGWVVEVEDGGVWAQTDEERLARYPKAGSKVEIRRAALGSFFMNLDGQRALRVRRVK